jgi:probable HAF family extracellular repeat protein
LGTLGGPDAFPNNINEQGQIAGMSFTNSTPNPITGIPTLDPFLWEGDTMIDLGTLGGTVGVQMGLNSTGQVVGTMNLAGDVNSHGFLWDRGFLLDLGTLGGNNSQAWWINDAGHIVGRADLPGSQSHHAFLWKNGVMTDLGVVSPGSCSTAISVNSKDQVLSDTGICGVGGGPPGFSEHGQPMVDINTLVLPGSGLQVVETFDINDRGEIAGSAALPNGDMHAVVLVPASEAEIAAASAFPVAKAAPITKSPTLSAESSQTPSGDGCMACAIGAAASHSWPANAKELTRHSDKGGTVETP